MPPVHKINRERYSYIKTEHNYCRDPALEAGDCSSTVHNVSTLSQGIKSETEDEDKKDIKSPDTLSSSDSNTSHVSVKSQVSRTPLTLRSLRYAFRSVPKPRRCSTRLFGSNETKKVDETPRSVRLLSSSFVGVMGAECLDLGEQDELSMIEQFKEEPCSNNQDSNWQHQQVSWYLNNGFDGNGGDDDVSDSGESNNVEIDEEIDQSWCESNFSKAGWDSNNEAVIYDNQGQDGDDLDDAANSPQQQGVSSSSSPESEVSSSPSLPFKTKVEKIISHRFKRQGRLYFKIKWDGYDIITSELPGVVMDHPDQLRQYLKMTSRRSSKAFNHLLNRCGILAEALRE